MTPDWNELTDRALALGQAQDRRGLLGIVGLPGSGKSTFAEGLVRRLGRSAAHVPMDGFHLADAQLHRLGIADRKGAPETFDAEGYLALLHRLARDRRRTVFAPAFERDLEQPVAGALAVEPGADLVVSEGNYLLLGEGRWPKVRAQFAEVWWVEQDEDTRVRRLIERHVAFGKSPDEAAAWVHRSDAANAERMRASAASADLVVHLE